MKSFFKKNWYVFLLLALVLAACAKKAATSPMTAAPRTEEPAYAATEPPAIYAPEEQAAPEDEGGGEVYEGGVEMDAAAAINYTTRMIIKDGNITLLVKDTDVAIDRLTQVVTDVDGYIISSRIWFEPYGGENYKYATYTIGVPVDRFEQALARLRGLAVRVVDESASGTDVSDEYVDLQSQLTNLQATRDRIRTFLDQAKTVEEALIVNQQLTEIEAEISKIQGRMNYLSDRAAFSTITIQVNPDLPPHTPTPTAVIVPTVTPSPTATPIPWSLSPTATNASNTLVKIYQKLIEMLTWILIVLVPILLPPLLLLWFIWWLLNRKRLKAKKEKEDRLREAAGK